MSEAAKKQLLQAARERMREKGRRGLRRIPPRPRRPEREIRRYTASLRKVTRAIERAVRDIVFPEIESILEQAGTREDQVRSDNWSDRIADLFMAARSSLEPEIDEAQMEMISLGDEVNRHATEEEVMAIRATLGVKPGFFDDEKIGGILGAWKRENLAFITRMSDESIQEMMSSASRAVRSGRPNKEIKSELRKRFSMTENRARRIARTEISQLNAQITRERQKEVGIEKFIWVTAGDERVRDEHEERHGKEYPWNDPPDGEMPGMPVNCRCTAIPAVTSLLEELERE